MPLAGEIAAVPSGYHEYVRIVTANLLSVVILQEELGFRSSRRDIHQADTLARSTLPNERRTHEEIAPRTNTVKELGRKVHLLEKAVNWPVAGLEGGHHGREFRKQIEDAPLGGSREPSARLENSDEGR